MVLEQFMIDLLQEFSNTLFSDILNTLQSFS